MDALKRNKRTIIYTIVLIAMATTLAVWSVLDANWWLVAGMTMFVLIDLFDLHNLLKIRKGLKSINES
jgi:hypothetical protein